MRIRPVEQVVDRDPVADERALALLLRVQAAKPLVARLSQRDVIGLRASRRPAEVAKAGREDDERRASVASLACASERLFERTEDGAIGTSVGQRVSCAGGLASSSYVPAIASLPIGPADRVASGKVEERELAVAIDFEHETVCSSRHAPRVQRGSSPDLRQNSAAAAVVGSALAFRIERRRNVLGLVFHTSIVQSGAPQ